MIYFMQPFTGGPVKIGYSENVDERLRQLEHQYGLPLVLLGTMDGDVEREREIHAQFAHLRFGRKEQFRPAADLMAFIGRPLLVDPNADAVEAVRSKETVVTIKGSEEWKRWLEGAAAHCRLSVPALLDIATAWYAKNRGIDVLPPER